MNARVYERFWTKVTLKGPSYPGIPGPCWLWTAAQAQGYGRFGNWDDRSRSQLAHRVAYEMIAEAVSPNLTLDHACPNTHCVNPAHLEPVPLSVNVLRGHGRSANNLRKTHCPAGHEFTPENTYLYRNRRGCRICRREQFLAFKERQRQNSPQAA